MATWATIRNNTLYSLGRLSEQITTLQEQASSGKQVARASDAPGQAFRILHLHTEKEETQTYLDNLNDVVGHIDQVSSVMEDISGALTRVHELVNQGATGTFSSRERMAIGQEINALLDQMVSLANTKTSGRYLFSGSMLSTQPYQATRENGNISSVEYVGSRETNHAPVAPNVDYPATVSGESVFGQMKRFTPVFPGDTGLAAGQSTSNATGDVWLEVRHTTTAYAGLGIVPAANANADDTILGPLGTHQLHVDGVAGTIRLDNGEEVDLAGQTSLELTNENGAKAYVDVSGWSGVGGTVDIASDGEMSIDDWATATPITFSNDQQLTDADGDLLYVDTTGAVQSGIEPVQMRGTYDIFSALIHIRDLMLNTRELSSNDQAKMLSHSLDSLEEVSNTFTQNMTAVGGRLKAMDTLQQSLDNILAQANEQSAMLEDADIVQVATDLAHVQNFYTLTLSSTAKLLQTSLLDFVR